MTKKAIQKAGSNAIVAAVDNEHTQLTKDFVASIGKSVGRKSVPAFGQEVGLSGALDAGASIQRLEALAVKGNARAQFDFGLCHLHGKGVEQDVQAAGYWFAMAADQQYPPAYRELGTLSRVGWGAEPDLAEACSLQLMAAESGDKVACRNLADYRSDLVALALEGDRQMASFLVQIYDHGLGVKKSPALTWAWLRWAHDGCEPVTDATPDAQSINDDITEAFRFVRTMLDKSVMEEGEAQLEQWLQEAGLQGPRAWNPILWVRDDKKNWDITLRGRWSPQGAWQYDRIVAKWSKSKKGSKCELTRSFNTWRGALGLMDEYAWHRQLLIMAVHPEFAQRVWQAYERRWSKEDRADEREREYWKSACGRPSEVDGD